MKLTTRQAELLGRELVGTFVPEAGGADEQDTFCMAAATQALQEAGVRATLLSRTVVLDPERAERPVALLALRVGKTLLTGLEEDGWEPAAEAMRRSLSVQGEYVQFGRTYQVDTAGIRALNKSNPEALARLDDLVAQARARVQEANLERSTGLAAASLRVRRRL